LDFCYIHQRELDVYVKNTNWKTEWYITPTHLNGKNGNVERCYNKFKMIPTNDSVVIGREISPIRALGNGSRVMSRGNRVIFIWIALIKRRFHLIFQQIFVVDKLKVNVRTGSTPPELSGSYTRWRLCRIRWRRRGWEQGYDFMALSRAQYYNAHDDNSNNN